MCFCLLLFGVLGLFVVRVYCWCLPVAVVVVCVFVCLFVAMCCLLFVVLRLLLLCVVLVVVVFVGRRSSPSLFVV